MTFHQLTVGQTFSKTFDDIRAEEMYVITAITEDDNRIHYDADLAQELGHPGRVNQGSINMSYVTQAVFLALESPVLLESITVRFEKPVYEHDTVTATSTVEKIEVDDPDGVVEFTVRLEKEDGTLAVSGSATARFPEI